MKKIILMVLISFCFKLNAQIETPKGVHFINNSWSAAFLKADKNGVLWQGSGARDKNGIRSNDGLYAYRDSSVTLFYTSGIFTDMLETDSNILFTNYSGIYKFQNNVFTIDNTLSKSTSITNYNQKIYIGTYGKGLFEKTNTGYQKIPITINGKSYDSINCLTSDGSELWIGTTDGLLLYNGNSFQKFSIPLKNSWNKFIQKHQKEIISIQKDIDGKVWVLNNNNYDTLECLYFLANGVFNSAFSYYKTNCNSNLLIPFNANRLALNNNGNVLLGIDCGLLVLEKNNFRFYQVQHSDLSNTCNIGALGGGDKNGNIFLASPYLGLFKIIPSKYDNSNVIHDGNITYDKLDINDLVSNVSNTGISLKGSTNNTASLYSAPINNAKIGCASPIYASAIWMGGNDASTGNLHIAAETYRQNGNDFKPGPIDLISHTYDSTTNSFYNKIWKINKQTIDNFIAKRTKLGYIIPNEILNWPAHGIGNFAKYLAPFVDIDGNGLYEPLKGDYPKIKGDQMLWWVFNDLGAHNETKGNALGVEVHGSCYAYYNINLPITDSNYIINRTIFFNYKTINRSENDYNNFHTSVWSDIDLGNYSDDYIGCDTLNNASFGYNANNNDKGRLGFGKNPPILYCKFLNNKMKYFNFYYNSFDPIKGNPNSATDYFNYMKKYWYNTNFAYPGKICDSIDTQREFTPSDNRGVMSTNIHVLKKDSVFELEFAYILLHNPNKDWLKDGCDDGSKNLKKIQNWYNNNNFPSKPYWGLNIRDKVLNNSTFSVFPNPANSTLNVNSNILSENILSIILIDVTGKIIEIQTPMKSKDYYDTTFDILGLASGIYIVKLNTYNGTVSKMVIKE